MSKPKVHKLTSQGRNLCTYLSDRLVGKRSEKVQDVTCSRCLFKLLTSGVPLSKEQERQAWS